MVDGNGLQELALDGIARFQTDYSGPDTVALTLIIIKCTKEKLMPFWKTTRNVDNTQSHAETDKNTVSN